MLDDEQLVRPLQQLVDRRAHRRLDDVDEPLGVELAVRCRRRACRGRAGCASRAGRARGSARRRSSSKPASSSRSRRLVADEALRARARVDAGRLDADDAADAAVRRGRAMPISATISCVASSVTGVLALAADTARGSSPRRAARAAARRSCCAMCSASASIDERLADHDALDRLLEELGEARHVDALLRRGEVDGAVDLGRDDLLEACPSGGGSPSRRPARRRATDRARPPAARPGGRV